MKMNILESFTSNRIIYNLFVLFIWTLTSFICHHASKTFLTQSEILGFQQESLKFNSTTWLGKFCRALILSTIKIALCYILIRPKQQDDTPSISYSKTAMICHALATLATNYSLAMMAASSTFTIKLMEPITSAIIQYVTLGIPLTSMSIVSLPVIVGGAIVFVGNPLEHSSTLIGTLSAVVSNVVLAFRNIAIKQMNSNSINIDLHWKRLAGSILVGTLACLLSLYLESVAVLPVRSAITVTTICISALFHVMYSYVSTGLVLAKISVVSHAVSNLLKRLLVVLLLYMFGRRAASSTNFLGLAGCTVGLLVYIWDKTRHKESVSDTDFYEKRIKISPSNAFKFLCWGIAGLCVITVLCVNPSNLKHIHEKGPGVIFQSPFSKFRTYVSSEGINPDYASDQIEYFSRNSFSAGGQQRPTDEELQPLLNNFSDNLLSRVRPFLKRRLIHEPTNVNFLSKQLTRSSEIIREAQRVHFNVLEDSLKKFKYAMLFDISAQENKGDSAITVGQVYFLRRMNIEIIYYCSEFTCTRTNLKKAQQLSKMYTPDELVILCQGGGNIIRYPSHDKLRYTLLKYFSDFHLLIFTQGLEFEELGRMNIKEQRKYFCCNPKFTMVLRDPKSYHIAKEIFNGSSQILMAPDMAFQIGHVKRIMSPVFDIIWIKRIDKEAPGYEINIKIPGNLRVHISEWLSWTTLKGENSLENCFNSLTNGLFYLQRGRVLITDRLHGHILSTLLDMPHVLIDNSAKKMARFHNTWTKSLENTLLTDDPNVALELAIGLLQKYNDTLPAIAPFLDINENFKTVDHSKPLMGYP